MATSSSRLSYNDCYDILNLALQNTKGIKVEIGDYGIGNHLRVRLHTARTIDRKDNRQSYQPDHKLYGRSIYDPLVIQLKNEDDKWWMYIQRMDASALNIEPLGEDHVFNQSPPSNLRAPSGEGGSQSSEEASEETHDVFDGEEEKEAELAVAVAVEAPPPSAPRISSWRRL